MATDLESQIKRLKLGDHICAIYENPRERLDVAVPFVIDGLARGERCVYILDESGMGEIVQALTAAGVDVRCRSWAISPGSHSPQKWRSLVFASRRKR